DRRREEAGELEPGVTVRCAHHGNLDTLIAQSSDTSGPFSFDRSPPFELEAEFAKEINRPSEVFDDDSHIVHPLERHASNLQDVLVQQRTLEVLRTPAAIQARFAAVHIRSLNHEPP